MKHPSEYTTQPFKGMNVMVVDSGTKITDDRTGKEAKVDDENIVQKGGVIWCTQSMFEKLKKYVE